VIQSCENHFPTVLKQRREAQKKLDRTQLKTEWWDHNAIEEVMRKYAKKMALKFLKSLSKNVSLRPNARRREDVLARLDARKRAKLLGNSKSGDEFVSKELKADFSHNGRTYYPKMPTDEDALGRIDDRATDLVAGTVLFKDYTGPDYKDYCRSLREKHRFALENARKKKEKNAKKRQKKSRKPVGQTELQKLKNSLNVQNLHMKKLKGARKPDAKAAATDKQNVPSKHAMSRATESYMKARDVMSKFKKNRAADRGKHKGQERSFRPDEMDDKKDDEKP
jgi:hypothetical protein